MRKLAKALGGAAVATLLAYGLAYVYFHAGLHTETCRAVAAPWPTSAALDPPQAHPMAITWYRELLYVADAESGAVKQYRNDGTLVAAWSGFRRPVAVAPTDRAVYVADFLSDQIVTLDSDGRVLGRWGRHGTAPGEFDAPAGIAVDRRGNIYVSDFYNHRIQKFDAAGRFVVEWGGRGRTRGRFRYPAGIAIDAHGNVFVADAFNNRVQVFSSEGTYLRQWGGIGFGIGGGWPGWFRLAKDIALDTTGNVYVADAFNDRVQKFTPTGKLLSVWQPNDPAPRYPSGVAVDPDGTAYVAEFYANRVRQFRCE